MSLPVTHPSQIPEKVYFRIGEVSSLIGVDSHVLRYWETEFKDIKPHRAKSNQRLYKKQDVELLLLVKTLLHEQGYTISGARKLLTSGITWPAETEKVVVSENKESKNALVVLKNIKEELISLQELLNRTNN